MNSVSGSDPQDAIQQLMHASAIRLVKAYLSNHPVPPAHVSSLLGLVHAALAGLAKPHADAPVRIRPRTPAEIRGSIQHDGIVSFIDGRVYKTLKRHLAAHGLTPQQYRRRYGLPSDYPITAPAYAAQRAEIARGMQRRHQPD